MLKGDRKILRHWEPGRQVESGSQRLNLKEEIMTNDVMIIPYTLSLLNYQRRCWTRVGIPEKGFSIFRVDCSLVVGLGFRV